MSSERPLSPHCARNREPILDVLRPHFLGRKRVLEIGSGTGEHAVFFSAALPATIWQTSDLEENLAGIRLWIDDAQRPNLPPPLRLDVRGPWPEAHFDAAFTANTLHIMSWPEVSLLFSGLTQVLEKDALLAVYGPFNYGGAYMSDSNREFDAYLKRRSPASGIRNFEDVNELATSAGFETVHDYAMPANNRLIFWRRIIV